jgi:hypothetical protein
VLKNLGIVGIDARLCRLPKGVVAARPAQAIDEFKRWHLMGSSGGDCFVSLLSGL